MHPQRMYMLLGFGSHWDVVNDCYFDEYVEWLEKCYMDIKNDYEKVCKK